MPWSIETSSNSNFSATNWEQLGGVLTGIGLFGAGVFCIVSAGAAGAPALLAYSLGGGALTGAGISSAVYAATSDEKSYSADDYIKHALVGAVSGVISGGAGASSSLLTQGLALEGIKKLGATVVFDAAGSVLSNVASNYAEVEFETDAEKKAEIQKNLTPSKLAVGAVANVLSSQATQFLTKSANKAVSKVTQKLLDQTDEVAMLATQPALKAMSQTTKVTTAALVGGAVGATVGGAAKAASNYAEEKDIWKDVKQAAVVSAISASVMNAARAANDYKTELQKLNQEVHAFKTKLQLNVDLLAELNQLSPQWLQDVDPELAERLEQTKSKLQQQQYELDELEKIGATIKALKQQHDQQQTKLAPQTSPDTANAPTTAVATPPPNSLTTATGKTRIYYFSQPLDTTGGDWIAFLDDRARHVGIIVDDPTKGLIKIEIGKGNHGKNTLKQTPITEFHRQTTSNKGRWLYEIGNTQLTLEDIIAQGNHWVSKHTKYEFNDHNCRSFAGNILKHLFAEGRGEFLPQTGSRNNTHINRHRFFKSPCEEIEHRIKNNGFNTDTHTKPRLLMN